MDVKMSVWWSDVERGICVRLAGGTIAVKDDVFIRNDSLVFMG